MKQTTAAFPGGTRTGVLRQGRQSKDYIVAGANMARCVNPGKPRAQGRRAHYRVKIDVVKARVSRLRPLKSSQGQDGASGQPI